MITEASPLRLRSSKTRAGVGVQVHDAPARPQKVTGSIRLLHDVDNDELEAVTLGVADLMEAELGEEDSEAEVDACSDDTPNLEEGSDDDEEPSDDEEDPPPMPEEADQDTNNEDDLG